MSFVACAIGPYTAVAAAAAAMSQYKSKPRTLALRPAFAKCRYCARIPDLHQTSAQCVSCGAPLVNEKTSFEIALAEQWEIDKPDYGHHTTKEEKPK